jgi:hypothetical protein
LEGSASQYGNLSRTKGHISSLKLLNHLNKPDEWKWKACTNSILLWLFDFLAIAFIRRHSGPSPRSYQDKNNSALLSPFQQQSAQRDYYKAMDNIMKKAANESLPDNEW